MKEHEVTKWTCQARDEEWPQDLQLTCVNDSDGFFRGNCGIKDVNTGKVYTSNEEITELSERNNRYKME